LKPNSSACKLTWSFHPDFAPPWVVPSPQPTKTLNTWVHNSRVELELQCMEIVILWPNQQHISSKGYFPSLAEFSTWSAASSSIAASGLATPTPLLDKHWNSTVVHKPFRELLTF
jgi:hypothetical protein